MRAILVLSICIAILSIGQAADIEAGLVAYYPLEEGGGTVVHNAVQGTVAGDGTVIGTGCKTEER